MTDQSQSTKQQNFLKLNRQENTVTARLKWYLDFAQLRLDTATESEALNIKILKEHIRASNDALDKEDIGLFGQSFEYVVRYAVELNLPAFATRVKSQQAAKGGKGKAASYEPLRLLAIKLYEENKPWYSTSQAAKSSKLTVPINQLAEKSGLDEPTLRTIRDVWLASHVNKNKS